MKTNLYFIILVIILILITGCTNQNADAKLASALAYEGNLRIVEIELPGMFCISCAYSAKTAFEGMNGVVSVDVDIETKKGIVIYNPDTISKEKLINHPLIQIYNGKILDDKQYLSE